MHRNERFSKDYHEKIKMLLDVIMPYLMTKYREMPVETHELNKSLAQFLKVHNITLLSHTIYCLYHSFDFDYHTAMSHIHGPWLRISSHQFLPGQLFAW